MAELLLGIDGGGSKTRALLADAAGTVLGMGVAASSNYQSVGFERASAALLEAITEARAAAGVAGNAPVAAACFGLAGVDRPDDQVLFLDWLAEAPVARRHQVVNDAELVLAGGTPDGWGVALICGTGSICFGRTPDGRSARSGGWGYLLGDEGSGYDIAVQALRLATQTADGRADAVALLQAILETWQLAAAPELIGRVYRAETTRAEIAALAPVVVALGERGDPGALRVLAQAATDLGAQIAAVVRALNLPDPPVAFGGGLLGGHPKLQQQVLTAAAVPLGPAQHVPDPAIGAVRLAQRLAHTTE